MNPVSQGPHSRKAIAALSKLKWLVVAENFAQETAAFWQPDILSLVDLTPEDVATEVFLPTLVVLPTIVHLKDIVSEGRLLTSSSPLTRIGRPLC